MRIQRFWAVPCWGVVGSHLIGQLLWSAVEEFTAIAKLASMGDVMLTHCKKKFKIVWFVINNDIMA